MRCSIGIHEFRVFEHVGGRRKSSGLTGITLAELQVEQQNTKCLIHGKERERVVKSCLFHPFLKRDLRRMKVYRATRTAGGLSGCLEGSILNDFLQRFSCFGLLGVHTRPLAKT